MAGRWAASQVDRLVVLACQVGRLANWVLWLVGRLADFQVAWQASRVWRVSWQAGWQVGWRPATPRQLVADGQFVCYTWDCEVSGFWYEVSLHFVDRRFPVCLVPEVSSTLGGGGFSHFGGLRFLAFWGPEVSGLWAA